MGSFWNVAGFLLWWHDIEDLEYEAGCMCSWPSSSQQRDIYHQVESHRTSHQQPELQHHVSKCFIWFYCPTVGCGARCLHPHSDQASGACLQCGVQPWWEVFGQRVLWQVCPYLEYSEWKSRPQLPRHRRHIWGVLECSRRQSGRQCIWWLCLCFRSPKVNTKCRKQNHSNGPAVNVWDCSILPMMGSKLCELDLFESTWKSPIPGHRILPLPPPLICIQKFKTQTNTKSYTWLYHRIWFPPRMLSWGRMKPSATWCMVWFPSRTGSHDWTGKEEHKAVPKNREKVLKRKTKTKKRKMLW